MSAEDLRAQLEQAVAGAPAEDLPAVLAALAEAEARAWARLTAPNGRTSSAADSVDENLSANDAARRLGVSREWLYRNAGRLPFAVRIGRRVLFSERGLERWNRQQRASGLT